MQASAQRDFHDALWRSHGGFDLVLSPVLISLLGLWVDSMVGTRPLFMLVFLAFGITGAVFKVYFDFQRGMEAARQQTDQLRAETEALRAQASGLI